MTRDEIIRMASECGFEVHERKQQVRVGMDTLFVCDSTAKLERFAALVAAAERWACAKIAARAAPQPPKLSDERIAELYQAAFGMPINDEYGPTEVHDFARAIEREIFGGAYE